MHCNYKILTTGIMYVAINCKANFQQLFHIDEKYYHIKKVIVCIT